MVFVDRVRTKVILEKRYECISLLQITVTPHSTHPKNRPTLDLIVLSLAVVIYTLSLDFRSLDSGPFMGKQPQQVPQVPP